MCKFKFLLSYACIVNNKFYFNRYNGVVQKMNLRLLVKISTIIFYRFKQF